MKSTTKGRLYSCIKARSVSSEYDIYSNEIWKLKREVAFCENAEMVYDVLIEYYTSGAYQRHIGQGFEPLISTTTVEVLRKIIEQREKEEKEEIFELAVKVGVIKHKEVDKEDKFPYLEMVVVSVVVALVLFVVL